MEMHIDIICVNIALPRFVFFVLGFFFFFFASVCCAEGEREREGKRSVGGAVRSASGQVRQIRSQDRMEVRTTTSNLLFPPSPH